MIDLVSEAKLVQDYFEENHWSFCFIGGLALLRWGDPREAKEEPEILTRLRAIERESMR